MLRVCMSRTVSFSCLFSAVTFCICLLRDLTDDCSSWLDFTNDVMWLCAKSRLAHKSSCSGMRRSSFLLMLARIMTLMSVVPSCSVSVDESVFFRLFGFLMSGSIVGLL